MRVPSAAKMELFTDSPGVATLRDHGSLTALSSDCRLLSTPCHLHAVARMVSMSENSGLQPSILCTLELSATSTGGSPALRSADRTDTRVPVTLSTALIVSSTE